MYAPHASQPANRIAECRKSAGFTQSEVAGRLRVDQATVSRWETGGAVADGWKHLLAAMFGVSVPFLMGWDDVVDARFDEALGEGRR